MESGDQQWEGKQLGWEETGREAGWKREAAVLLVGLQSRREVRGSANRIVHIEPEFSVHIIASVMLCTCSFACSTSVQILNTDKLLPG